MPRRRGLTHALEYCRPTSKKRNERAFFFALDGHAPTRLWETVCRHRGITLAIELEPQEFFRFYMRAALTLCLEKTAWRSRLR